MKLTFLGPLYARPGPYACAYLDTSRDIDDPERAIGLRRRHLREDLTAQGADAASVAVLADAAGTDRDVPGRHGQAIFASHGHLALVAELPEPPTRDTAQFASLPDALPLAMQHAPDIPYVAVALRRVDDGETGPVHEQVEVAFEAGSWPVSRVAPGARHRRRSPAGDWPRSAERIADELETLAHRSGAEAIVLCGDTQARGVLAHRLPERLSDRVVTRAGDGQAAGEGRALLEEELSDHFRGRTSARDRAWTERFQAQRARHRDASEGIAAVVAALQRHQARAVLVNPPAEFRMSLWAGPEPTQIALSAADLQSFGVLSFQRRPVGAALIRALVRTGAELVVVPPEEIPLEDGAGVVLRSSASDAQP